MKRKPPILKGDLAKKFSQNKKKNEQKLLEKKEKIKNHYK